ncbi:MAG: exosortase system-associated protein, TIGR04073 family [Nitrospirales bacterium]
MSRARLTPGILVCCLVMVGWSVAGPVLAEEPVGSDATPSPVGAAALGMGTKLVRGVVNVTTGWLEMPKQMYRHATLQGWTGGLLIGPFEGLGMSFVRTLAGAYEVLTFPLPVPPRYQTMVTPDYVWEPDNAPAPRR